MRDSWWFKAESVLCAFVILVRYDLHDPSATHSHAQHPPKIKGEEMREEREKENPE